MQEYGLYFGKQSFYDLIKSIGGEWNDTKERPIVCMMKALDYSGIYWAAPIGNWAHRSEEAKARIKRFMSLPDDDLRSCYYHVGKTDIKSIFFISDVIPIIDKYLEREYQGTYTHRHYIIQNKILIQELTRKVRRIISFERSKPNYFRHYITDVKAQLINELNNEIVSRSSKNDKQ